MNAHRPLPPRDDEIDALLARQYRDTTPEFEARWVALKRELRSAPVRSRLPSWSVWLGVFATGSVAAVVLLLSMAGPRRPAPAPGPADAPAMADLLAMDEVLGRGRILLNAEDRDALLHLPVQTQPSN